MRKLQEFRSEFTKILTLETRVFWTFWQDLNKKIYGGDEI
jgi:hypothetical protein